MFLSECGASAQDASDTVAHTIDVPIGLLEPVRQDAACVDHDRPLAFPHHDACGLVADDPFGHSTLGKGASRGWASTNVKGDAASNKGEDITWPWSEVEIHAMLWIAWFKA